MALARPIDLLEMSPWFPTYERGEAAVEFHPAPRGPEVQIANPWWCAFHSGLSVLPGCTGVGMAAMYGSTPAGARTIWSQSGNMRQNWSRAPDILLASGTPSVAALH